VLSQTEFLQHLRGALNHLYEPDYLRRSPIADALGLGGRFRAASLLQRALIDAIEALAPPCDGLSEARAWLLYNPLHCRYVEQMTQQEVADQMGVSTRQLRRLQRAALSMLADRLWGQTAAARPAVGAGNTGPPSVTEELAWLRGTTPEALVDLAGVLGRVGDHVEQLAEHHEVGLEIRVDTAQGPTSSVFVRLPALEQALLTLASIFIRRASPSDAGVPPAIASGKRHRGIVQLHARRREIGIEIALSSSGAAGNAPLSTQDEACWEMAVRLAEISGGRLTLADDGPLKARLTLLSTEKLPVLAIDDNADTLQLFQRYTAETRYHVIGTRDPDDALTLAVGTSPRVVILDVMMPQVDGWELLARLRQHPQTSHIPVIVCTILPQEELAVSMGASAYISKPVSRTAFLAALDRNAVPRASERR
jgi:CheY-like chemotaxis protein